MWQAQVPVILSEPFFHFSFSNCHSQPNRPVLNFASCSEKLWEKQFIAFSFSVPNQFLSYFLIFLSSLLKTFPYSNLTSKISGSVELVISKRKHSIGSQGLFETWLRTTSTWEFGIKEKAELGDDGAIDVGKERNNVFDVEETYFQSVMTSSLSAYRL
jgi:hypothetical protein